MRVMSADWTTCRVVRDRDGDLWFRGCDSDDLWTANTNYPDVFLTTDEVLTVFGPLTPVLDADGLPVVTTVGDLTARHLGKRVRFRYSSPEGMGPEDEGVLYAFDVQRQRKDDVYVLVYLDSYDNECFDLTPDTPCEVLA